ncbi:MAG: SDR family NAD(P)-dependent oxidoreductase [Ancalomicrobiaceae bacterium]|nr:SDR family NAD(P)-dependent oxidoreductase [Ancalomicrobiaceae bacterium]
MGGAIYPNLDGKVVLVTGGGSGIGASIVRHFARQKAKVGFLDIARTPSEALVDELAATGAEVAFQETDLTDTASLRDSVQAIRSKFGPIGVLINNAGHDERHRIEDVTPEFWDERMAVNLKHQFFAAQAVVPDMKAAGGGSIVNLGSISWLLGMGGLVAYATAKAGVLGMTKALARDFGPFNIRVNAIAPGWIMTERQLGKWVTPEAIADALNRQCLKRRMVPADIAKMAVFLASEEASGCTAQQYIVDCGWV